MNVVEIGKKVFSTVNACGLQMHEAWMSHATGFAHHVYWSSQQSAAALGLPTAVCK